MERIPISSEECVLNHSWRILSGGLQSHQYQTGEEAVMAHKSIDSRLRVSGYGIDTEALNNVAIPAIEHARDYSEVIVIDEMESSLSNRRVR